LSKQVFRKLWYFGQTWILEPVVKPFVPSLEGSMKISRNMFFVNCYSVGVVSDMDLDPVDKTFVPY